MVRSRTFFPHFQQFCWGHSHYLSFRGKILILEGDKSCHAVVHSNERFQGFLEVYGEGWGFKIFILECWEQFWIQNVNV